MTEIQKSYILEKSSLGSERSMAGISPSSDAQCLDDLSPRISTVMGGALASDEDDLASLQVKNQQLETSSSPLAATSSFTSNPQNPHQQNLANVVPSSNVQPPNAISGDETNSVCD